MANKRFPMPPTNAGNKGGVTGLLETGPETPIESEATKKLPAAEDQDKAFEERMVAGFSARRNPLNISAAASPELKAKLALIGRIAEDTIGSRQYTESAIIRGLAELLLEANIDWRAALAKLPPGESTRPAGAIKAILVAQLLAIDHSASSLEHL